MAQEPGKAILRFERVSPCSIARNHEVDPGRRANRQFAKCCSFTENLQDNGHGGNPFKLVFHGEVCPSQVCMRQWLRHILRLRG